jgi:hypothetical protein
LLLRRRLRLRQVQLLLRRLLCGLLLMLPSRPWLHRRQCLKRVELLLALLLRYLRLLLLRRRLRLLLLRRRQRLRQVHTPAAAPTAVRAVADAAAAGAMKPTTTAAAAASRSGLAAAGLATDGSRFCAATVSAATTARAASSAAAVPSTQRSELARGVNKSSKQ